MRNMTPALWQEVKRLYHAVLEAEPSGRRLLLESAAPEVRCEVESLLSQEDSGTNPVDRDFWSNALVFSERAENMPTELAEHSRFGQYEILAPIGRGGMGEVYLAHDHKLGRDVAIKALPSEFSTDPERLSRLRQEARVLASFSHPNIATIYGLEEHAGVSFLVLELVKGETLAERLQRTGPMSPEESLAVMSQVADALEGAHQQGVIHRDVKPANVKLTAEGRVKVLDFGLAKPPPVRCADAGLDTAQGRILGTPRYMSPEQARGQPVDQRRISGLSVACCTSF